MTGWRAGFLSATKPVIKAVGNLQGHVTSNPSNLAQYAALAASIRPTIRSWTTFGKCCGRGGSAP